MNNTSHLKFLAIPSATVAHAWVGIVTDGRQGRVQLQTLVAYRSASEARFGARRAWVAFQRAIDRNLKEMA